MDVFSPSFRVPDASKITAFYTFINFCSSLLNEVWTTSMDVTLVTWLEGSFLSVDS